MIVKEIEGNLLEEFKKGSIDVMVHGCNCFHIMGAGIAAQIRYRFPESFEKDLETPCGDMRKLGTYSQASFPKKKQHIINMYTQFEPGANFEYKSFIEGMKKLQRQFKADDLIFGFPEIGCGIGGGQWPYVKDILEKSKLKIIIVHYDQGIKTVGSAQINLFP
jgi:O-acetyl-ADP-ribose deacetylase (regulator of RNase III)